MDGLIAPTRFGVIERLIRLFDQPMHKLGGR